MCDYGYAASLAGRGTAGSGAPSSCMVVAHAVRSSISLGWPKLSIAGQEPQTGNLSRRATTKGANSIGYAGAGPKERRTLLTFLQSVAV